MHNGGGRNGKKGASRRSRKMVYTCSFVRFHPSHRRRQSNARPVRYLIRSRLSSIDSITRIHVTLPRKKEEEKEEEGEGGKGR